MTNKKILLLWSTVILLFISCGEQDRSVSANKSNTSASIADAESPNDTTRIVIKSAEIKLQVDDVSANIKTIMSAVKTMNGQVLHYEVNSNREYQQEIACSLDSSMIISHINPQGFMKVKVPIEQSDSFIHTMLSMNASIDKLLVDEDDVTEDLTEKSAFAKTKPSLDTNPTNLKEAAYADHQNEVAITRKTDYSKLHYRTQFLWFDIYLQGHSYIEKSKTATIHDLHEPFYVKAYQAIKTGGYAFSILLIALLHIWPFILLIIAAALVFKRTWLKEIKKTIMSWKK